MRKYRWFGCLAGLLVAIFIVVWVGDGDTGAVTAQSPATPEATVEPGSVIVFSDTGTAQLTIPSLNGNQIVVQITKPAGDGPFPALIGVAGADNSFALNAALTRALQDKEIVAVDFAPQGRSGSEGEDNFNGPVHQDDLKALVDFVSEQAFVQPDSIGLLTYSYGLVMATGALARYPDMPVAFLIDWEGPSSPGRDIMRGLANGESWAEDTILMLSDKSEMNQEEMEAFVIHGGMISDEAYWIDRDAIRFIEDLPCPYLRVQFTVDHVQGTSKYHMMAIINTATEKSGQWTRCNDNPPNILYTEEDLGDYHFHTYVDDAILETATPLPALDAILLSYIDEMFFARPYDE